MTRILALGQRLAGDDAVALAAADALREAGVPVAEIASAADLVTALEEPGDVLLLDAFLGEPPGALVDLEPSRIEHEGLAAVSSHGIDVPSALALAAALYPGGAASRVRILGVAVGAAPRFTEGLSPPVAAAVPRLLARVRAILPPV